MLLVGSAFISIIITNFSTLFISEIILMPIVLTIFAFLLFINVFEEVKWYEVLSEKVSRKELESLFEKLLNELPNEKIKELLENRLNE